MIGQQPNYKLKALFPLPFMSKKEGIVEFNSVCIKLNQLDKKEEDRGTYDSVDELM